MFQFIVLLLAVIVFLYVDSQRPPPGVNPQHYQQQQYQHQPQYQVPQQHQYQQQNVPVQQPPVQQAPIQQQYQQVPVQQYQQAPVQQQVPQQQVPMQRQPAGHGHGHDHGHQRQVFNADNIAHEKEHIQEHMEVPIDTSKMSDQELQFHYFKMHDSDNNNKLDGCELIKSLIHWHEQGSKEKQGEIEEKIFKDEELVNLIDPILNVDDTNRDGFIDYPEFIKAQQKAAGQKQDKPQH
ncbi:protein lag-3-like isoform X1 [Dendroctonus ponderosae]|uniref:EF-hand domain-containing protein n=1 Tax=Dendroctonus ponderosae TaxID=77166 RepID=J3JT97_DENPD|nr:protein lag-3 isoform X1 [Dendroctonus ponderosae]XP_048520440.1 protein lag-3-like isoform X1 [Dendroctonus ponderosae]XP_048524608.1 protein lag-3-like isoform X1 [Dendroctonus ponderosae]AEE61417.1 unknown [Dendroctonus ponderosae]